MGKPGQEAVLQDQRIWAGRSGSQHLFASIARQGFPLESPELPLTPHSPVLPSVHCHPAPCALPWPDFKSASGELWRG